MKNNSISNRVLILSFISLFTDIASEMLYPVMPIYLQSIGFSAVFIGVLEGFAEATAGLSKGYFGHWSDRLGTRRPFVQIGYGISALSKPAMILFSTIGWVFLMRTADRLGKGVRTGARDALLSEQASAENKATIFGFHRAMDTLGAAIGPFMAMLFLMNHPFQYRNLFVYTLIPGLIAVILTLLIKENKKPKITTVGQPLRPRFFDFIKYWKQSPVSYRKLITALLLFSLINSSDVFLLLMLKKIGASDSLVIGMYVFFNLIYAASSYPIGKLTDKLGFKISLVTGLLLFSCVYLGFSVNQNLTFAWPLLLLYSLYAACTEGMSKAWICNLVPAKQTATAIGFYTSFSSLGLMFASVTAGLLWEYIQPSSVFLMGGCGALVVAIFLYKTPIANGA